jgi:hypothetical protein
MIVKVLAGQSLFDIAIQYLGNIDTAFEIAQANGRMLSDDLVTGENLIVPDELSKSNVVLQYYSARGLVPATALTTQDKRAAFAYEFALNF